MLLSDLFRTPGSAISPRRKTGWIGIDIGTAAIKIAQLQQSGGKRRLVRSLVIRADENRPFDLAAFESGHIGAEIKRAFKIHGGFAGQTAACVVSMNHCQLRTLVSAKGTEDEQRELISLEIENDLNSAAQPLEFDFWDASTGKQSEDRGMTQVYVVSIPQSFSDSIANNMLRARLQCVVLDAVPFATVRASEMMPVISEVATEGKAYAILDWGHSMATLTVVYNGQPLMTRTLKHCGLRRILQAVSQRMKLSGAEAEALLTTYGVTARLIPGRSNSELQSLITELSAPVLHDLMEEIRETFGFLKLQFPQQIPESFCLLGGGAAIRNIATLVQQETRMPTHVWNLAGSGAEQVSPVLAAAAALSALAWEL